MKQYIMNISKRITPIIGMVVFAGLTQEAQALPMFTAQTGMDCAGCHTQVMPRLNKFGRKFAASGMTMSQKVADMNEEHAIDQDNFLDTDINPSLMIKSKYARTWDKPDGKGAIKEGDTNDGELSIIRMATFSVGGRVNENVGGMLNLGWRKEEGDSISGKVTYANAVEDGYWGVTAYSTPSFGPFAGMEFYNTGLYKLLRTFDMRIYSNAVQSTKVGAQAATGVQAYYDKDNLFSDGDHFFVTAGIYSPAQDNLYIDMTDNILGFGRVAYEHPIGDFNVMIGAFAIGGGDTVLTTEEISVKKEMYGMDMQIEGYIADKEAALMLTSIFKNKVEFTGIGAQLTDDLEDIYNSSFSAEGTLSMTDELIGKLGYMTFNDRNEYRTDDGTGPGKTTKINVKDIDYAFTVGADYGFTISDTTMKLALEYAWIEPSLERVENYQSFMATLTLPF